jgi:NAD(P)-dependent dehydrogenase (short-subunit alcohol dehydrogenase family)
LDGQVALVTGGGRGVGRAIALSLAHAGASVAVAARTPGELEAAAREIQSVGRRSLPVVCDVSSGASVSAAVHTVQSTLGPIDILVNNAGTAESAPLVKLDQAVWDKTIAVNLTGTYLCSRAVLPSMVERGRGRIINIASIAAKVGFAYTTAYCAAKHGVLGFTRALALEVAAKGITVNAICPGWLDTEMTIESINRIVERTGLTPEEARRRLERMSPQQRLITPAEVAAIAVFLSSGEAHGITGQALNVDGGEVMS